MQFVAQGQSHYYYLLALAMKGGWVDVVIVPWAGLGLSQLQLPALSLFADAMRQWSLEIGQPSISRQSNSCPQSWLCHKNYQMHLK